MRIIKAEDNHLSTLMSWFKNQQEVTQWGGPHVLITDDVQALKESIQWSFYASYALLSESGEIVAFGQFYEREHRCHIARIAVCPNHRGQGLVAKLINQMIKVGTQSLNVEQSSLFVWPDNKSAIKAYQKLGFIISDYPNGLGFDDCLYMVK